MTTTIFTIVILSSCILIHELGHFLAAKYVGIPITQFSIGLGGPTLVKFHFWGTEFRISPFLLGGYVKPSISLDQIRANYSYSKRFVFYVSGAFANFIIPTVLLVLIVGPSQGWTAAFILAGELPMEMVSAVADIFRGTQPLSETMGPIGITREGAHYIQNGARAFLFFYLININLAVVNLIPIPILDGGRIVMMAFEKIRGWSRIEGWILSASALGLLSFFGYVTYKDVVKAFF